MTHLKTHSGEKSNTCNQCDYATSDTSNLRKHFKTHETSIALNSNTPYTDVAELSEEVKSMMGFSENDAIGGQRLGKAWVCKVCGKEGYMSDIERHIETYHITGIVLPCNICGKTSPTRKALQVHKTRFHKQ